MDAFYIDPHKYYGRPIRSNGPEDHKDPVDRIPAELACYDLLDSLGILYSRVDHAHADTIEAGVQKALELAGDDGVVLCFGSLYIIGDIKFALDKVKN